MQNWEVGTTATVDGHRREVFVRRESARLAMVTIEMKGHEWLAIVEIADDQCLASLAEDFAAAGLNSLQRVDPDGPLPRVMYWQEVTQFGDDSLTPDS